MQTFAIVIRANGSALIDGVEVPPDQIGAALRVAAEEHRQTPVFVSTETRASFEDTFRVMTLIREAGFTTSYAATTSAVTR
jgi:biopolymer transport protein ExbD